MSVDLVDDLEAAEATIATLGKSVTQLSNTLRLVSDQLHRRTFVPMDPDNLVAIVDGNIAEAEKPLGEWETYCRPTCGWAFDPDNTGCDPEFCGCPCNHGERAG